MRPRYGHLLLILAMAAPPLATAGAPAGEPVSSADRAIVVKQLGRDVEELDPQKDLDITKIDLNDDKHANYVVAVTSSLYCGSGGCSAYALMSDGDRYRQVLPAILAFGVTVADTRTRGVKDLLWQGRGDSPIRLIWNGKSYERADGKK